MKNFNERISHFVFGDRAVHWHCRLVGHAAHHGPVDCAVAGHGAGHFGGEPVVRQRRGQCRRAQGHVRVLAPGLSDRRHSGGRVWHAAGLSHRHREFFGRHQRGRDDGDGAQQPRPVFAGADRGLPGHFRLWRHVPAAGVPEFSV